MKTKYILHGGLAHIPNSDNDKFFQEILKDTADNLKVLLVFFSKEDDRISVNKAEDVSQFEKNKGGKNLFFEVAQDSTFIEQIQRSDIIYFHGRSSKKLIESLEKFPNLKEKFKGKIVAGESAGANALSTYCYAQMASMNLNGLGILPFRTICHYQPGDEIKLKDGPANLEMLLLPEYKYKIFIL